MHYGQLASQAELLLVCLPRFGGASLLRLDSGVDVEGQGSSAHEGYYLSEDLPSCHRFASLPFASCFCKTY